MGKLRRERAVVSALSIVFLSSSLLADVRAVEPTPSPQQEEPDPAWRADGARVVEREAVALGIPSEGGTSLAGEALDPSVDLRGTPTTGGLPADVTPAQATELTGWRTEHSRSILNPDGTITAEYSGGRLNYLDANGAWQPLDLSLVAADGVDAFDVAVTASDREVRFTTTDLQAALGEVRSGSVALVIRPLDYEATLSQVPAVVEEPEAPAEPAPSPTASPSQPPASPTPEPSPTSGTTPAPVASGDPSPEPAAEPSPSASPEPSAPPEPSVTPSPSASPSPSPTPTPAPADPLPGWVFEENRVAFAAGPDKGRLVAHPTDTGFEFSVVIDSADQEPSYAFAVDAGGLTASLEPDGRTVRFQDVGFSEGEFSDRFAGSISAPVLLDAHGSAAPPETVAVTVYDPASGDPAPAGVSPDAVASLGPTEVLVVYAIDEAWLGGPDVAFPVTLDPTVCVQVGGSGCTSGGFEHYVGSGQPSTYPNPPSMMRVGYDDLPDANWAHLRSMAYFADVSLPDGAHVTAATLDLRQSDNHDASLSPKIQARLLNKPWGWDTTFDDVEWAWENPYNSPTYSPCSSSATTDCTLSIDVEKIVRAWYTRRGQDWKPNIGISLVHEPATTTWEETDFYLSTNATVSNRPKLTITYVVPKVEIDFAPELGANYAPSTMLAGQATRLPINLRNKGSGFNWNKTNGADGWRYRVGYRFFDAKGKVVSADPVGSNVVDLPVDVLDNDDSGVFALAIDPPDEPGSYTLRLDLVHDDNGTPIWASDWAAPSLYYSRNKKVLSADNTRWTGTSVIERDEFQINVVTGGGTATGELRAVELGDGSTLGIDLHSGNLRYEGSGGIGFDDLVPLELSYGYDSANAVADSADGVAGCDGILDACGWYTNWDERITPDPDTAGIYTYQDPAGNRYQVDTDGNGQLISGAPVLLERVRYTGFDENVPVTSGVFVTAASEGLTAPSGDYIYEAPSSTSTLISGLGKLDLNAYQHVKFAMRTTGDTTSGISFQIQNITDPGKYPTDWFTLTTGSAWTPPHEFFHMGGTIANNWASTYWVNLYDKVRTNPHFGRPDHSYQITAVQIQQNGGTGSTYLDALRFLGNDTAILTDSEPSWSVNGGAAAMTTSEFVEGTASLKVEPRTGPNAPSCQATCFTALDPATSGDGDLYAKPFVSWHWRKVGGTSVAIEFNLKDTRTNATGQITYYAGPVPPPGATNPIQVSDTVPVHWTKVTRNVLEDGRQVLNFFNDNPTGSGAGAPPSQGPTPDEVQWIGVKPWAPDGLYALLDDLRFGSIPRRDDTDDVFADDYVASYGDGGEHWFNRDGLLEEIRDLDGNSVTLDWTQSPTTYGQDGFTLSSIHAPTDNPPSGTPYTRRIDVAIASGNWTFTEKLGTTTSPITGRSTKFFVGSSDVTSIKPARTPACGGANPSGCVELTYATHKVTQLSDPRWTGATSGANDYRFDVTYAGNLATAVSDRSKSVTPLLKVVSRATGTVPVAERVLWQDAAAGAANMGIYTELTSDGSVLYDHEPLPCLASPCAPSTSGLASKRTVANEFDGLARVSTEKRFSAGGATPLVSRQGTRAAAKVDNYNDPLAAGGVAWTQSPDQHYASIVDSGGSNPDLYRTFKTYDAEGNELTTTTQAYNARPDYAATTKSVPLATGNLKGYWRLGESSGTTAVDGALTPHNGTYAGTNSSTADALVGDPDRARSFDGLDDTVTIPTTLGSIGAPFTVSVWAQPDHATNSMSILGSRGGSEETFDLKFMNGTTIRADIGTGTAWIVTAADAPFPYVTDRWYHVVYTVRTDGWSGYVDGQLISSGTFTATTPRLTHTQSLVIGNPGFATEHWDGLLDEVAVYNTALTSAQVRSQFLAGRSVAEHTARTIYDAEGHPLQVDDQFLVNPGFESGLEDWDLTGAPESDPGQAHPPLDPDLPPSNRSAAIGVGEKVQQDVALVPGQTVRFQLWQKRTGAATARIKLDYWQRSGAAWVPLVDATKTSSSWASHAWDVTLPLDTDGRVRVSLFQASGAGSDTVWYDDVAILTSYARTSYKTNGLTDFAYTFAAADGSGGPSGEIALHPTYAATSVHPAIFTTSSVANDVASPSGPDQDVTSTATYDAWGRTLIATDPDGVDTQTSFVTSGNGKDTDVAWTEDGLDNRTIFTYDLVGNQLNSTSPLGRTTSTTYDLLSHPVAVIAPDGVVSRSEYDNHGLLSASFSNYVNGNPDGGAGLDDVKTTYTYDGFGRLTSTIGNDGGGSAQAKSTTAYDLLGRATASSIFATWNGTAFSGERKTETRPDVANALTRPGLSGTRGPGTGSMSGPLVPTAAPAPTCPDNGSVRCNTVASRDLNGQPISLTDAYGKVTRTFNDLAGRPVVVVANYVDGVYSDAAPDTDLVAVTQYDVGGRVAKTIDVLERSTETTYDALGRPTKTVSLTATGTKITKTETVYTPAGRVDRVSRPAANADAASAMAWTKTVYDAAGRAIKTLDHYDLGSDRRFGFDAFEQDAIDPAWDTATFGSFVIAGATRSLDSHYHWTKPFTGRGRLRVSTSGAAVNEGVSWLLPGTFKAGRTYRMTGFISGTSGHAAGLRLGSTSAGTSVQTVNLTGTWNWAPFAFAWTPGSDTSGVRFSAVGSDASPSVYSFYLDDVALWDTTSADHWNIPTETVYDADGRVTESILPPGDAGSLSPVDLESPLVTETAYDATGRVVAVSVANRREVVGRILNTNAGAAYWPLDEAGGTAVDRDGANDLTPSGGTVYGVAPAITEGRTAVRFDGSGYLSRAANVSSVVDGFSIEAWVRTDAAPVSQYAVVVRNGDASNGWGLGINTSGNVVGQYTTAGAHTWLATTNSVVDGAWHHLVLVRDAGTTTIYVDGTAYSVTNPTSAPGTPGAAASLGRESASGRYFTGELDEVAIYASALSSSDVTAHYNAGRITTADANLTTTTRYDALGRATDAFDPTGTRTHYGYDRLGRLTETVANYENGVTSSATGDDDVRSTFAYNAAAELTAYCPARNVQSADACDPTSTTTTSDAYKSAWHYGYDEAGHLTTQVPPVAASSITQLSTKFWVYDPGMRLTKSCDAPAGATSCATATRNSVPTYDGVGRVTVLNTYSGSGTTLALRTETTYLGDGAVDETKYSEGATPTLKDTIDATYDTSGRLDQLKRGTTVISDFAYNPDHTISARADGDANAIGTSTFGYDWADRLTSVDLPSGFSAAIPTFAWRADGLVAKRTWDTGSAAVFEYDRAKRPTSLDKGTIGFDQAYDRDGNVTSEARSLPSVAGDAGSGTQSFSYDDLNRLTGSSGLASGSRSYTYDLDGNRLSKTEGADTYAYTYDRTDQLVSATKNGGAPTVFSYDPYGNLTSNAESVSSVTSMTYDLGDKLTGIDAAGTANDATFTFDALGRFRTRLLSGSTDTYSYVGTSETVTRIATSGGTTTDSIVSPAGDRLGVEQGTTLNWFLPDLHGNVAGSLDATEATVVSATRYDAYGEIITTGSAGGTAVGQTNWKFQGRLDISPTGLDTPLYDMSARFYSPGLGAFTQVDSFAGAAQNPLSMNRFLYALGNPATLIDPSGHAACYRFIDGACQGYHDTEKTRTAGPRQSAATKNWRAYQRKAAAAENRVTTRRNRPSTETRRNLIDVAVDVVDQWSKRAHAIRSWRAGGAFENALQQIVAREAKPGVEIRRDETIKNPFTGRSIDPRSLLRPDWQFVDEKTGELIKVLDAKSSETAEGAAAMERHARAKYEAQVAKQAKLTGQKPASVEIVTDVRGRYVSPRVHAGAAFGAVMLLDILVTGGGDWGFIYDTCYTRGGSACLPG